MAILTELLWSMINRLRCIFKTGPWLHRADRDNRIFDGPVEQLTYSVNNPLAGIAPGFIKRAPLAWFCSHHRIANGGDAIYSYSYLFKYKINLPAGANTLTLPNNPKIRILAATVARNDNDATQPAQPLYDNFTDHEPIMLRDPK